MKSDASQCTCISESGIIINMMSPSQIPSSDSEILHHVADSHDTGSYIAPRVLSGQDMISV